VPRLLALLLLASAGCHRFPDDTPVDAYRSLLSAVQRDDDARTRATGGALHPLPVDLLQADPRPPGPTQVSVKSEDARTAVLAVSAHGTVQEVRLVNEAGHWRVVIPALEKRADG
jgi:hypothetical protein